MKISDPSFFTQNAIILAKELLGKFLCVKMPDASVQKSRITQTEAYLGSVDSASHACHGKTNRNSAMFENGGVAYVYLCYGIHYMLNIVSGVENIPEAVLIRGTEDANGPGLLTKKFNIDKSFNKKSFLQNEIWLEDDGYKPKIKTSARIGISYALKKDQNKKWRFYY